MSEQSETPAAVPPTPPSEEPIPLEPIALEPVAASTPGTLDQAAPTADTLSHQWPPSSEAAPVSDELVVPPLPPKVELPPESAVPTPGPMTNPKLTVVRGLRMDLQYPLYPGKNYLGRTDEKPVDVDLTDQESDDRIWASRQHAVITFEDGKLAIEDLNSLNGTFVNRSRVHPGQLQELAENDVVQVGTVHLKVTAG